MLWHHAENVHLPNPACRNPLIRTSVTPSRRSSRPSSLSKRKAFKLFFLVEFKRARTGN